MAFEGVPAGPFLGRDAIGAAYAAQPPTDEVVLLGPVGEEEGVTVADYAWDTDGLRAGRMRLRARGLRCRGSGLEGRAAAVPDKLYIPHDHFILFTLSS